MSFSDDPRKGTGKRRNAGNKFWLLHVNASKSMLKAMKGNQSVQAKVLSGKLDKVLGDGRHKPKEPENE